MCKIDFLGSIPRNITLACSGGPDSMAVLDFLIKGRKNVTVAYFDHGTDHGETAREFLVDFCEKNNIAIKLGAISNAKPKEKSLEEWWRDERYDFLNSIPGKKITCHHLDDVAEWWIFSSLNGNPRLIPYENGNIIRPFLLTPKEALVSWCKRKTVPFVTDPGNKNLRFARSRIRHNIVPEALKINPGLLKVLKKKIIRSHSLEDSFDQY